MKKDMTRRSFLKLAGAGLLAVAMSGAMTGCEVKDYVSATIGDVEIMLGQSLWLGYNVNGGKMYTIQYQPSVEVRNMSQKAVTYGGSGSDCDIIITCVLTDQNGKQYPMTYTGKNGSVPAGGEMKLENVQLTTTGEGIDVEKSKAVLTLAYRGRNAVFTDYNNGKYDAKVE